MSRSNKHLADVGVEESMPSDPAQADSVIDNLLPTSHAEAEWSVREVVRLAVQARLAADFAGAMAAHRLLADVLGSTRGGYAARRDNEAIDEAEAEALILEAADLIRARRGQPPA